MSITRGIEYFAKLQEKLFFFCVKFEHCQVLEPHFFCETVDYFLSRNPSKLAFSAKLPQHTFSAFSQEYWQWAWMSCWKRQANFRSASWNGCSLIFLFIHPFIFHHRLSFPLGSLSLTQLATLHTLINELYAHKKKKARISPWKALYCCLKILWPVTKSKAIHLATSQRHQYDLVEAVQQCQPSQSQQWTVVWNLHEGRCNRVRKWLWPSVTLVTSEREASQRPLPLNCKSVPTWKSEHCLGWFSSGSPALLGLHWQFLIVYVWSLWNGNWRSCWLLCPSL